MSRDNSGSELFVSLLSQLLASVLLVVLLRGYGCLPAWSMGWDLLLIGSCGFLFWRLGRGRAVCGLGRMNVTTESGANTPWHDARTWLHLSHEIRSPMNALVGYARLLKNGQFRDELERQKQLEIVHQSGVHLLELVDQILAHSKLENGHDQVRLQDGCLFSILFETKELFQRQAAEKGLTLDLDIPHALPSTIRTDPLKVQQLLHNLVSNAIKFTSNGSIHLCAAMGKAAGERCLEVRVVDSGVGIPKDQIERIFTPFFQLPPVAGRSSSGTGLGLAISRHLADQLGGTLEVQSAVGAGTVFTLRLNCEGQSDSSLTCQQFLERRQVELRRPPRSETNRLSGLQVMIVDDDAAHRRLFQLYLEQRGATTLQAEHGQEALQLFEENRVDLVLVDMQMPVMDGIETMVQLRRQGFRKPVVGISAQADVSPGCEDRELGFSGWLQKPVDSRSLDRFLSRLLRDDAIRGPSAAGSSLPKRSLPPRAGSVALGSEMRGTLNGRTIPTVQVPAFGCPMAGHHWQAHPAHSVKNGHAPRDGVVLPPAETGNQPAQTAHSSWPVARKRFAEIRPLFLATLRNKLDDIKECPLGRRGPLLRQFAHWLKGTAPTCGFPHFSRCVDDLERALEKHGDPSCISQLEEIEAIAESFGEALGRPVAR